MTNAANTVLNNVATVNLTKSQQTANSVTTTSTTFVDVPTFLSIAANKNQQCAWVLNGLVTPAGTMTMQLIGVTSSTVYDTRTITTQTVTYIGNIVTVATAAAESIKWQYKTSNIADTATIFGYPIGSGNASQMLVADIILTPSVANTTYTYNLKLQYSTITIAAVSTVFTSQTVQVDGLGYNYAPGGVPSVTTASLTLPFKTICSGINFTSSQITLVYIGVSIVGDYISLS